VKKKIIALREIILLALFFVGAGNLSYPIAMWMTSKRHYSTEILIGSIALYEFFRVLLLWKRK